MKTKKLTIDLGNNKLTDAQMKKLLAAVHTAVNKTVIVKKKRAPKVKSQPPGVATDAGPIPPVKAAVITATFTNVNPGLSSLNATLNGVTKKLSQSGTLKFDVVASGDIIMIQGKSLGNSAIAIDVPATPQQKSFVPGTFNFNFLIL